jgi:hypothetical protein
VGIGTLRRYHEDSRVAGLTPAPQGSEDAPQEEITERTEEQQRQEAAEAGKVREFEAKLELNAKVRELDATQQVLTGPAGDRSLSELAKDVQDAAQAVIDAEEAVQAAIAEDDADRERVAAEAQQKADEEAKAQADAAAKADAAANPAGAPASANEDGSATAQDTKHGDLERPTAQGSTAAWIAYAKADPNGSPVADLTERKGLRDEIAQAYLGK